jgi:hypothetical protein
MMSSPGAVTPLVLTTEGEEEEGEGCSSGSISLNRLMTEINCARLLSYFMLN